MSRTQRLELLGLYVYWAVAAFLAFKFNFSYLAMVGVYLAVPAGYLAWRNFRYIRTSLVESVFYSLPLIIVFNFIAHFTKAWTETTQFDWRLLDQIPLENIAWGFFYILLLINFYSYFFDRSKSVKISRSFLTVAGAILLLDAVFLVVYTTNVELLNIRYFYALIVVIFVVGCVAGVIKHPRLLLPALVTGLALVPVGIVHELISLQLGHWHFAGGEHLAYVQLLGYTFPLEELVWIILATPFVILVHEHFADNQKARL